MLDWRSLIPRGPRNWLRNPRASLRWLRSAFAFRRGHVVTLDCSAAAGVPLILRCHPEAGRTFRLFVDDADHRRELRAFAAALPGGDLRLFDLGAHYGFFTLAALALRGAATRVLAVEPSPGARRVLKANLALAGGGARAIVLAASVGPADGTLRMLAAGVASEHYMFPAPAQRPDAVDVPQFSLPTLAREAGFAPSLLKLDVEGGEFDILTASANLEALRAWRAPLLLELHADWIRHRGQDPAAPLAALAAIDYELTLDGAPIPAAAAAALPLTRLLCRPGRSHTA
jgi:FkbM family methyltransferase